MSCWMKEIILDNCTKQVSLWTSAPVVDELHITTHYKDHYTSLYQEGNRHGFSTGIVPVVIVDAPPCGTCQRRIIESMSVYNPNIDPVTIFVAEEDPVVPLQTIIVEKIIQPNETRTMECICTCCAQQTFPPGDGINVYYEDIFTPTPPALVHAWVGALNFQSCLTATWDFVNNRVNVWIDMNCLEAQLSSRVNNTVFVMKNGNDATGEVEMFDLPFLTVQAAIDAAITSGIEPITVIVYPGVYIENIYLRWNVNIYMNEWAIIQWTLQVAEDNVNVNVMWHWTLVIDSDNTSLDSAFRILWTTSWLDVRIYLDRIYFIQTGSTNTSFTIINKRNNPYEAHIKFKVEQVFMEYDAVSDGLIPELVCYAWATTNDTSKKYIDMSFKRILLNCEQMWFSFYKADKFEDIYLHDTIVLPGRNMEDLGVNPDWTLTNYRHMYTNIYNENVNISWPFKCTNTYPYAFIPLWDHSTCVFKSCNFRLTDAGDITPGRWFCTEDILWNAAWSDNKFHFYEDTIIWLDNHFTKSLWAGVGIIMPVLDYHIVWWVYTNKPWDSIAFGFNQPNGVEHFVYDWGMSVQIPFPLIPKAAY